MLTFCNYLLLWIIHKHTTYGESSFQPLFLPWKLLLTAESLCHGSQAATLPSAHLAFTLGHLCVIILCFSQMQNHWLTVYEGVCVCACVYVCVCVKNIVLVYFQLHHECQHTSTSWANFSRNSFKNILIWNRWHSNNSNNLALKHFLNSSAPGLWQVLGIWRWLGHGVCWKGGDMQHPAALRNCLRIYQMFRISFYVPATQMIFSLTLPQTSNPWSRPPPMTSLSQSLHHKPPFL